MFYVHDRLPSNENDLTLNKKGNEMPNLNNKPLALRDIFFYLLAPVSKPNFWKKKMVPLTP